MISSCIYVCGLTSNKCLLMCMLVCAFTYLCVCVCDVSSFIACANGA